MRVIDQCDPDYLIDLEQFYIDLYSPAFNSASPASGRHSDETRAKISAAQRGNKYKAGWRTPPETRALLSAAKLGNKHALGTVRSPETRAKMSAAKLGNTAGAALRGRQQSPEHVQKRTASRQATIDRRRLEAAGA